MAQDPNGNKGNKKTRTPLTPEQKAAKAQEKADAFRRLATKRTQTALKAIRLVGQLSNRNSYNYTPEQVEKVTVALQEALDSVKASFSGTKAVEDEFTI